MSELATFNPFDPMVLQCPFPHYARMRDQAPVLRIDPLGVYFVTSYELVVEVLRDQRTYSSNFGSPGSGIPLAAQDRRRIAETIAEGFPRVPTMLTADQPEHTRYRRLVAKAFNPRAIAALEPVARATCAELIEAWPDGSPIEFVERFGVPLPVRVIARALNVPDDRLADFKRWSDDAIAGIGTNISIDQRVAAERGVNEMHAYFAEQIEQRRVEPLDDLLTNLLNARVDDDDPEVTDTRPLDMAEMLSILQQLLVAGNETTTKMLTEMMRLLGENPDQWQMVKHDPSRIERVVDETLRLSSPTQGMFRVATRDVELGGVHVPAGARLVVVFSSACRDESMFADADRFDPDRPGLRDHLAFGKGIHYCVGANLSRLEGRVALEELCRRLDGFSLTQANDFAYHPSFMLRGLTRLEIDFSRATERPAAQ